MKDKRISRVIWLTGLSGSGKTTIAGGVSKLLLAQGYNPVIFDGDEVRKGICKDLGFEESDREENVRRVAMMAKSAMEFGSIVICSLITPLESHRNLARRIIGTELYSEIHVSTPLEVCCARDPKGLYKKALENKIENFTGISARFESPMFSDMQIDTSKMNPEQSVNMLFDYIQPLIRLSRESSTTLAKQFFRVGTTVGLQSLLPG